MKKSFDSQGKEIVPFKGSNTTQENPPVYDPGTILFQGVPVVCFDENWKPVKCPYCGLDDGLHGGIFVKWEPTSFEAGVISEADIFCKCCSSPISSWAYGSYIPQVNMWDYDSDNNLFTQDVLKRGLNVSNNENSSGA